MSKSTCTPKRKALARTFKKMAKARKHENGGLIDFLDNFIEGLNQNNNVEKDYISEARTNKQKE